MNCRCQEGNLIGVVAMRAGSAPPPPSAKRWRRFVSLQLRLHPLKLKRAKHAGLDRDSRPSRSGFIGGGDRRLAPRSIREPDSPLSRLWSADAPTADPATGGPGAGGGGGGEGGGGR